MFGRSKRDRVLVDRSDIVVAYVRYSFGGAAQALRYAERRKKRILRFQPDNSLLQMYIIIYYGKVCP